jgi:hypothetical protein
VALRPARYKRLVAGHTLAIVRRRGIGLAALAAAAVGLAAARPADPEPAFTRTATDNPKPLYGIVGEWRRDAKLARVDRSLRPVRGPKLEIIDPVSAWAFSPDRSRLALGTACQAGVSLGTLQLVDLRRMRAVGCFAIGRVAAAAWSRPDRLLAVGSSPLQIFLIDPKSGRILDRTAVEGVELMRGVPAGDRLVVLAGRTYFGEAQQVVVADARGNVRFVDMEVPSASALVVEPTGRRAYLVAAGTVAEVDLDTFAVAYHELLERASTRGRRVAGLAPAAQTTSAPTEIRRALWLGGGLIAFFGSDVTIDGRTVTSVPVGLKLIDTRTWTVRTVDDRVTNASLAGDIILATGDEIGLVAYDLQGTKRFQLFRGRSLSVSETNYRGRAYVYVAGRIAPRVVDLSTGHLVGIQRRPLPFLLLNER